MNSAPDIYISLHNTTLGDEEQSGSERRRLGTVAELAGQLPGRWNFNPKIGLDI